MFLGSLACQRQHFAALVVDSEPQGSRLSQGSCLKLLGTALGVLIYPWMFMYSSETPNFSEQMGQKGLPILQEFVGKCP